MEIIKMVLVGLVAFLHLFTLYMEMFAWETKGKQAFKGVLPDDMFKPTKVLAANLGLYNGFLAAGLIWTFFIQNHEWKFYIAIFFLSCVIVAGIYGAVTGSKKIFYYQALPAIIALIVLHL